MPEALYLRVRNWEKFQHYKDRNPPWIKNYVELDDASNPFSKLSYADQGRLQKVWRLAAKLNNQIPCDSMYLARYLGMKPDAVEAFVGRMAGEWRTNAGQTPGIWLQVGDQKEVKRLEDAEKRAANKRKRASTALALRKHLATPEPETETREPEIDPKPTASANFKIPDPKARLLASLTDKSAGTVERIDAMHKKYRFAEGDFEEAREAALSGSATSPSAVAISTLKRRGQARAAAA